jgi:hypothetical protein
MDVSTTPVSYISIFFVILQENVCSEFFIYRLAQSFYVVLVKNCLLYSELFIVYITAESEKSIFYVFTYSALYYQLSICLMV